MYFKTPNHKIVPLLFFSLLSLFHPVSAQPVTDAFLEKLLKKHPQRFESILRNQEELEIQVIYTRIDRDRNGVPSFSTYRYRVEPVRYFYPGGSIGLAAAALALEKINNLGIQGLTRDTPMLTLAGGSTPKEVLKDSTSENGLPSVGHYIRRLLLADDPEAYDRLFEFLGQEYFNDNMRSRGYTNFRAAGRLGTDAENRYTNPVKFVEGNRTLYEQKELYSEKTYTAAEPIRKGKGYYKDGRLIEGPMDFQDRDFFNLQEQHRFLMNLMFPEKAPPTKKLNLSEKDYAFLYRYMSQLPVETEYPEHYSEILDDASVKYLLFGKTRKRTPRQIRSFNKIGEGYGYLVDNAYIADFEMGVEFLLSAVIYCNRNQVFEDGAYEYEPTGYQFMADLGKTILEYELARKRKDRPNLERFEVEYDK